MVHNHGSEEGAGLGCPELRLPDGSNKGQCVMTYDDYFDIANTAVENVINQEHGEDI